MVQFEFENSSQPGTTEEFENQISLNGMMFGLGVRIENIFCIQNKNSFNRFKDTS